VVGVQDEEHVEGECGIGGETRLSALPQHVHEVFDVGKIVVRVNVGEAVMVAVRVGDQRRHLGDEANDLELADERVLHVA
jgi:hypothetical protein